MGSLGLLFYPAYLLVTGGSSVLVVVITLAAVALFASVYLWLWLFDFLLRTLNRSLGAIIVLTAIAVALNLAYPNLTWGYLFGYLVGTAGFVLPRRLGIAGVSGVTLIAMTTLLATRPSLSPHQLALFPRVMISGAIALFLIGLGAIGVRSLVETSVELRAMREARARLAVQEERHRFARDLHDLLGHSLSLITLKTALAGRLLPNDPVPAAAEVGDIERVARRALHEVREAVKGYRQPALVAELAEAQTSLAAAQIECRIEAADCSLPGYADAIFAWVVREGVTNVLRHSHATRCTLRFLRQADTVELAILDDGVGHGTKEPGSGLIGLQERLEKGGGRVEARRLPLPDRGHLLRVTLPMGTAQREQCAEGRAGGPL